MVEHTDELNPHLKDGRRKVDIFSSDDSDVHSEEDSDEADEKGESEHLDKNQTLVEKNNRVTEITKLVNFECKTNF